MPALGEMRGSNASLPVWRDQRGFKGGLNASSGCAEVPLRSRGVQVGTKRGVMTGRSRPALPPLDALTLTMNRSVRARDSSVVSATPSGECLSWHTYQRTSSAWSSSGNSRGGIEDVWVCGSGVRAAENVQSNIIFGGDSSSKASSTAITTAAAYLSHEGPLPCLFQNLDEGIAGFLSGHRQKGRGGG